MAMVELGHESGELDHQGWVATIHAPLSGSGSGDDQPPVTLGMDQYVDGEDANNAKIRLDDFFQDDHDATLHYELLANSNPALFDSVNLEVTLQGTNLILDFAADAFGEAAITIRGIDSAGHAVDDVLPVILLPVNDRPTTHGFSNIVVEEDAHSTVIDLFESFDDVEDGAHQLTYSITEVSNPDLFSSIVLDSVNGSLTFNYAPNRHGSSEITIRATDTEGLYVEMSTRGLDYQVYDHLKGEVGTQKPDVSLDTLVAATNYALFYQVDGEYQFDRLNEPALRTFLRQHPAELPFIFGIENDFYNNSPEGRDRFAEVFSIVQDERPDLERYGLYRIMPERSWLIPVDATRRLEDLERDVFSYYSNNSDVILDNYDNWLMRNELFRTEPVSIEFGGTPLSDMVGLITPSLFTFHRGGTTPRCCRK